MTLYCGRCFHDRGLLVPLTYMQRLNISEKTGRPYDLSRKFGTPYPYGCSFCGEERHDGGVHVREHIVITDKGSELEIAHVPHVVTSADLAKRRQ
jgi:hypothetical protein